MLVPGYGYPVKGIRDSHDLIEKDQVMIEDLSDQDLIGNHF